MILKLFMKLCFEGLGLLAAYDALHSDYTQAPPNPCQKLGQRSKTKALQQRLLTKSGN